MYVHCRDIIRTSEQDGKQMTQIFRKLSLLNHTFGQIAIPKVLSDRDRQVNTSNVTKRIFEAEF